MTTIRLATSVPSLVSFICGLFIAPALGKKLPYKATLLAGCLLCIVGGILPAFWNTSYTEIILGRVLYGFGFSVFSCRNAIAVKEYGVDEAAKWMRWGAFMMTGVSIIAQPVSGMVSVSNWRNSFWLHAAAIIPLVIILFMFKEPEKETTAAENTAAASSSGGERKEFLNPRILIYLVFVLLCTLCLYPFLSSISVFVASCVLVISVPWAPPILYSFLLAARFAAWDLPQPIFAALCGQ